MLLVPYRQGQMQLFQLAASRLMLASFFHLDWLVLPGTVSACLNSFREWLAYGSGANASSVACSVSPSLA